MMHSMNAKWTRTIAISGVVTHNHLTVTCGVSQMVATGWNLKMSGAMLWKLASGTMSVKAVNNANRIDRKRYRRIDTEKAEEAFIEYLTNIWS